MLLERENAPKDVKVLVFYSLFVGLFVGVLVCKWLHCMESIYKFDEMHHFRCLLNKTASILG